MCIRDSSLPASCNQIHIQIGTLPEPVRSALKLNKTSRLSQCLSKRFLKMLIVSASTTLSPDILAGCSQESDMAYLYHGSIKFDTWSIDTDRSCWSGAPCYGILQWLQQSQVEVCPHPHKWNCWWMQLSLWDKNLVIMLVLYHKLHICTLWLTKFFWWPVQLLDPSPQKAVGARTASGRHAEHVLLPGLYRLLYNHCCHRRVGVFSKVR